MNIAFKHLEAKLRFGDLTIGQWAAIFAGVDGITEVPSERWDVDAFYDPNPAAPGRMTTVVMYSGQFSREREDAARRWMLATMRGARDIQAMPGIPSPTS